MTQLTMTTETITWIATADRLPDDDRNVLQAAPGAMVWPGFCVNGVWYSADGCAYAAGEVTHWAEMPKGPR